MNYIALTGRDMPAMARAAELLLQLVTQQQVAVAIALYVNNVRMANTLKQRAGPHGIGELWRIGDDHTHPHLNHLVDLHVPDATVAAHLDEALRSGLAAFRHRVSTHATFTQHHRQPMEISQ